MLTIFLTINWPNCTLNVCFCLFRGYIKAGPHAWATLGLRRYRIASSISSDSYISAHFFIWRMVYCALSAFCHIRSLCLNRSTNLIVVCQVYTCRINWHIVMEKRRFWSEACSHICKCKLQSNHQWYGASLRIKIFLLTNFYCGKSTQLFLNLPQRFRFLPNDFSPW